MESICPKCGFILKENERYTVQKGDTLWSIAGAVLGDCYRWKEIFETNKNILKNRPDFITEGMVLRILRDNGQKKEI